MKLQYRKPKRVYADEKAKNREEAHNPKAPTFASLDTHGMTPGERATRITRSAAAQLTRNATPKERAATRYFLKMANNAVGKSFHELAGQSSPGGGQTLGEILANGGRRGMHPGGTPITNGNGESPPGLLLNELLYSRGMILDKLLDPRRDIDRECGYPIDVTPWAYRLLYDREGVAHRVVEVLPNETWAKDPTIYEDEGSESETPFEQAWSELVEYKNIFHFLHKVDQVSGIGRFGVLLMGFDDGKDLAEPIDGINERGEPTGEGPPKKLLFLRTFDESVCYITAREGDFQNPRYSQPRYYNLIFRDLQGANAGGLGGPGGVEGWGSGGGTVIDITKRVHWSRVIHVADNRQLSEIYGIPRMQPVLNRLIDLRKVLSGSGEMFWKGAYPGISFEINPALTQLPGMDIDEDTLRKEIENYQMGLQRYILLTGLTAKSLAPQVADPSNHVDKLMEHIATTLGIPLRVFIGSERGSLASSQDQQTWNLRLAHRQEHYVSPMIVRPFVERLIALRVLPEPEDGYTIEWEDLNTKTDTDRAAIGLQTTQAMAAYVAGNVDELMPPAEYLERVIGLTPDEIQSNMDALDEHMDDKIGQQVDQGVKLHEAMQKKGAVSPNAGDPTFGDAVQGGVGASTLPNMSGPNSSGLLSNPNSYEDMVVQSSRISDSDKAIEAQKVQGTIYDTDAGNALKGTTPRGKRVPTGPKQHEPKNKVGKRNSMVVDTKGNPPQAWEMSHKDNKIKSKKSKKQQAQENYKAGDNIKTDDYVEGENDLGPGGQG